MTWRQHEGLNLKWWIPIRTNFEMKEFQEKLRTLVFVSFAKWDSETIPVRQLEETSRNDNSESLPKLSGSVPVKRLEETSMMDKFEICPKLFGRVPFSSFCLSIRIAKCLNVPKAAGTEPWKKLESKFSWTRFWSWPNQFGNIPTKRVLVNTKFCKWGNGLS